MDLARVQKMSILNHKHNKKYSAHFKRRVPTLVISLAYASDVFSLLVEHQFFGCVVFSGIRCYTSGLVFCFCGCICCFCFRRGYYKLSVDVCAFCVSSCSGVCSFHSRSWLVLFDEFALLLGNLYSAKRIASMFVVLSWLQIHRLWLLLSLCPLPCQFLL